ncbi:hypothetical protein [Litchfieldella rifensis]|uniref:Uncharacterized protein n=1 Tax=Litchfieldella rifensis TaxID=762643 RepID=A0ABV7LLA6_9GAMM
MTNDSVLKLKLVADPEVAYRGDTIELTAIVQGDDPGDGDYTDAYDFEWNVTAGPEHEELKPELFKTSDAKQFVRTDNMAIASYTIEVTATPKRGADAPDDSAARGRRTRRGGDATTPLVADMEIRVQGAAQDVLADQILKEGMSVTARTLVPSADQGLWIKIRECLKGRRFGEYKEFIDGIMCGDKRTPNYEEIGVMRRERCAYQHGVNGYQLLKAATEVYLLCHACCGDLSYIRDFDRDEEHSRLGYRPSREEMQERLTDYLNGSVSSPTLPYLNKILDNLNLLDMKPDAYPYCGDSVRGQPCLFELIWSYWHEEGMLMQTINAITLRFQNRRVRPNGEPDPLANLALDPLRPLNNLLWGYLQDTHQRLTVARRAYEYEHEYGLRIVGKAVGDLQPVERRTRFLEAFHALLHAAAVFYHDEQNRMVQPDPFPILEKIRAVHMLLAEGAHNQFGDLPSTARMEMMIAQWLISQPPMREFLQSRAMVPYGEPWMGQVDAMRKLMGWPDVSISYFSRLAYDGEMILLSIRYGHWTDVSDAKQAENWIRYWRPEIQGYIEAYRTVTGADLAAKPRRPERIDTTQPSVLLQRRSTRSAS